MYKPIEIVNDIYYVGVNDRRTSLFENMLPIPLGVSYNSYVIIDEKTALIDTVELAFADISLKKISQTLQGRKLDYLIINHMEPDHSGGIKAIIKEYPEITLVGNKKTFEFIKGYYGDHDKQLVITDHEILSLGKRDLEFILAPMLHWPETMFTYDRSCKMLFSGDGFGGFGTLDGGIIDYELNTDRYWDEIRRYYASIVGKYGSPVQKAIRKLDDVDIDYIGSTHGPVWHEDVSKIVSLYDQWSRYEAEEGVVIAYGSMYGNTGEMAEVIARKLAECGIKNIVIHDVSKSDATYILSDIFRYKAVIIGSPTYCNELYPAVESLLNKIQIRGISDRYLGVFGSFSWAGTAVKRILTFSEKIKWEVLGSPIEERFSLTKNKYEQCEELAETIAARLVEERGNKNL